MTKTKPPGQRTETTSPYLAIVGAIVIIGFAVFAFSFWPDSDTLRTDATATSQKPARHVDCARFSAATQATAVTMKERDPVALLRAGAPGLP